jgi:hypothetical protein
MPESAHIFYWSSNSAAINNLNRTPVPKKSISNLKADSLGRSMRKQAFEKERKCNDSDILMQSSLH